MDRSSQGCIDGNSNSVVAIQSGHAPQHAWSALLISLLVVAGSYSILPIWLFLYRLWVEDPLRAIGAAFPLVAFTGTLVAWRRIGWSTNGTFWALPLLALVIMLARASMTLMLVLRIHDQSQAVLHPGLIMFFYGVGAVLLCGGTRLLRASIAPLCLLLFVNPVPRIFNTLVDLPLQFLSANTARHFAHLIGLHPTGEQLRMMFTPDFGMMIVPGCNGVRGSITLAYLALIFGYIRHLRPRALALTTMSAFVMGYMLNLLRLCVLVIYYRIGVNVPSVQPYGRSVDYGIGCTLFLFATLAIGLFIRWIEPKPEIYKASTVVSDNNFESSPAKIGHTTVARAGCFVVLMLVFIVPTLGNGNSFHETVPNEQSILESFPSQVGSYRLIRTYSERDNSGLIRFALADYSTLPNSAGASSQLTLGLYVGTGMHFVAYSRFAQGIRPKSTGSFDALDGSTGNPLSVRYATTLYDDSVSRQYNAESACYESGCSAIIGSGPTRIFFSSPRLSDVFLASTGKRLPILLRREWPSNDATPIATLRSEFEVDVRHFTEHLNLRALLREDGGSI